MFQLASEKAKHCEAMLSDACCTAEKHQCFLRWWTACNDGVDLYVTYNRRRLCQSWWLQP